MAVEGRRVLLAAHQGATVGGIGTMARGLAAHVPQALAAAGGDISVCVSAPECVGLGRLGARGAVARLAHEQVALARRAGDFDLVHLCDLRPVLLSSTPFVVTVHDVDFLDSPRSYPRVSRAYKAAMLRAAIRKRPAAVVCPSDYVGGRVRERFPAVAACVRVIRPGVAPSGREWTGGGEPPYFLTVSTVTPRKNHPGLLEAFRRARERGLAAVWVVAGAAGPGSASILAALRSEPGVRVLGAVDETRLDALYRDALFVATPSLAEGFGYPPLEAMARGTPTLSSDGGALAEVVGDAGELLPAGDVEAWAEALIRLTRDGDARERLSARGRRRAAELSWERTATAVVGLYRELFAATSS